MLIMASGQSASPKQGTSDTKILFERMHMKCTQGSSHEIMQLQPVSCAAMKGLQELSHCFRNKVQSLLLARKYISGKPGILYKNI